MISLFSIICWVLSRRRIIILYYAIILLGIYFPSRFLFCFDRLSLPPIPERRQLLLTAIRRDNARSTFSLKDTCNLAIRLNSFHFFEIIHTLHHADSPTDRLAFKIESFYAVEQTTNQQPSTIPLTLVTHHRHRSATYGAIMSHVIIILSRS